MAVSRTSRPARARVLVVEDDPSMRAYYARLFRSLSGEGYDAELVADAEAALEVLSRRPVDLLLLDWSLPGISGTALLSAVRAHPRTRDVGVLMVTGRGTLADELAALEAGSDDHVAKPFEERRLLARLRSLRRRRELDAGRRACARYPGLSYDPHTGRVEVEGAPVRLTPKELELLGVFLRRPDVIHPASYLWECSWGYESENWEHLLAATISSLRRKLGRNWGARLRARRGRGYRLAVL